MTDVNLTRLAGLAATTPVQPRRAGNNWFEAFAEAWGQALDKQASTIETMADNMRAGGDRPSDITMLTAESMRMGFMSNSSQTSLDSIAKSLETMARKG